MIDPNQVYYRAISGWEYSSWKRQGESWTKTEWIKDEPEGYTLRYLKEEWVDAQLIREFNDPYEIIVAVIACEEDQFEQNKSITPRRYFNINPIPFARIELVYDPRCSVSERRIDLDLNDPLKILRSKGL
jgi:hypothetical protein